MKKFYFLLTIAFATVTINAQNALFAGGDFENFADFQEGLNTYGLQSFATQGLGEGVDGSNSLSIDGTQSGNKYVFTAFAPADLPSDITEISFWVKGTSPTKSLSLNLYKESGYYKFNVGDLTENKTVVAEGSNQYTGAINTAGNWVKVTLDLSDISDYITAPATNFFALKIGKESEYAIDVDNFEYVSASMGTNNLNINTYTVKVAVANNQLSVEGFNAKRVNILNMNGALVANSTSVANLKAGTYIAVMTNQKGQTVNVKFVKK